ncbi:TetR/AcrR family transcriptional regulator [Kibdelosporangium lantanae]
MARGPRERLVGHAIAVLETEGVDAVTIRRVAREAGVSHGAPLRHFPTRADLLAAVAATGFARLQAVLAAAPGTGRDRLVAACRSYVEFARSAPALYDLMFSLCPMNSDAFRTFSELAGSVPAGPLWATLYGLVHMGLADQVDETVANAIVSG